MSNPYITYSAPHVLGLRKVNMSRGALEAIASVVVPETIAAVLRAEERTK